MSSYPQNRRKEEVLERQDEGLFFVRLANRIANFEIPERFGYRIVKRLFDIICGVIGCIILLPIMCGVKLAYLLTGDRAPIILKQPRIGQNGELFTFYKFRTMVPNADAVLRGMLAHDEEKRKEYAKYKKLENDPRITRAGNFLRKTSLDEFPQFLNVLNGTLSMIGNRPYMPRERADMGFYYRDIVSTKAGIISYWAVNGRNNVSFKKRLKLEQYYSRNNSFKMDVKILFSAIGKIFNRDGAK